MTSTREQLTELVRGSDEVLPEDGLEAKLKKGKPLIIKAGLRPDRARSAYRSHGPY